MSYIQTPDNTEKMLPKLVAMSPYEVYLNQIRSAMEPIRNAKKGLSYLPPQLGGLTGQRNVIAEVVVLEMITFEVN